MLNTEQVLRNRYRIIKVIGRGGMSTVYQAEDIQSGKLLAVKDVAHSGKTDGQIVEQSLVAEGRMLMKLSNSHLPRIYDVIEETHSFMLVMDYIEGQSLDRVIAQSGPQEMDKVLDWGMQICQVLDYLHNQTTPIIYRDMKPANVILKPDGQLMLIDFGTARTQKVGVEMQADTVCIGTAGFAAPEQFGGIGQSDARTDIFCLGATLYNMITGHSPCDRPQGILPLERWNPALANTPLASIIYKCTRSDPNERYQSAMELYEQLQLARDGMFQPATGLLGFRRSQWQKQDAPAGGMITGGLSTLLHNVLPGTQRNTGMLKGEKTASPVPAAQTAKPAPQPVKQPIPAVVSAPAEQPVQEEAQPELMQRLVLIGAVIAVVFVLLAVVLAVLRELIPALIVLIVALGGAALAVTALLMLRRRG